MLPYFTSDGHILSHKHIKPTNRFLLSSLLICPSLSFSISVWVKRFFFSPPSLILQFSPSFPSYLFPLHSPQPDLPLLPFSWLPLSLHAHLLSTIDNIPDGAPLLATHGQINQSNNTPINSNYAMISPGRALLGVGKDVAVEDDWMCFSTELEVVCLCIH